jgi:hypothetical protein
MHIMNLYGKELFNINIAQYNFYEKLEPVWHLKLIKSLRRRETYWKKSYCVKSRRPAGVISISIIQFPCKNWSSESVIFK